MSVHTLKSKGLFGLRNREKRGGRCGGEGEGGRRVVADKYPSTWRTHPQKRATKGENQALKYFTKHPYY